MIPIENPNDSHQRRGFSAKSTVSVVSESEPLLNQHQRTPEDVFLETAAPEYTLRENSKEMNLLRAIEQGECDSIKKEITSGTLQNPFTYTLPSKIKVTEGLSRVISHCSLMHVAVINRNYPLVKYLDPIYKNGGVAPLTTDNKTPLHFASVIRDPFMCRLLVQWCPEQLKVMDKMGYTPVNYAENMPQILMQFGTFLQPQQQMHQNNTKSRSQSIAQSTDDNNKNINESKLSKQKNTYHNVLMKSCVDFSPRNPHSSLCHCGQTISEHTSILEVPCPVPWKPESNIQLSVTNAFGDIEFGSSAVSSVASYVRISDNATSEAITNLVRNVWNLKKPAMILSILGTEVLRPDFQNVFMKGFWKAAGSSNSLITTDGVSSGIVKLCGRAVRDYNDAYGDNNIKLIAITPWQNVSQQNQEILINSSYEVMLVHQTKY